MKALAARIKAWFSTSPDVARQLDNHAALTCTGDAFDSALAEVPIHSGIAHDRSAARASGFPYGHQTSPYTLATLNSHTEAIHRLTAAYDSVKAAVAAMQPNDELRDSATELFELRRHFYMLAAIAYAVGAGNAQVDASAESLQATELEFKAMLLDAESKQRQCTDPAGTAAKAAALRTQSKNDVLAAEALDRAAKNAMLEAEVLKAQAARDDGAL